MTFRYDACEADGASGSPGESQPVHRGMVFAIVALALLMIGPAMDECLASLQFLVREHREGRSVWRAFWGGAP